MNDTQVIVQADKTVVKISGLSIKGLNTQELEDLLIQRIGSIVRIIGVTGSSLEMDVYGMNAKDILKDEAGIISAVSLAEGISASEVAQISYAKNITAVAYDQIPSGSDYACMKERWL